MSLNNDMLQSYVKTLDLDNHGEAASQILDYCTSNDDANDYIAVVYDPVSGWSQHGVSAGYYYAYFRQDGAKGRANIVVLYGRKGTVIDDKGALTEYLKIRADTRMDESGWEKAWDAIKAIAETFATGPYGLALKSIIAAAQGKNLPFFQWVIDTASKRFDKNEEFLTAWGDNNKEDLAVWDCRRYKGVEGAFNNSERTIWMVGSEYTMTTLKPVS